MYMKKLLTTVTLIFLVLNSVAQKIDSVRYSIEDKKIQSINALVDSVGNLKVEYKSDGTLTSLIIENHLQLKFAENNIPNKVSFISSETNFKEIFYMKEGSFSRSSFYHNDTLFSEKSLDSLLVIWQPKNDSFIVTGPVISSSANNFNDSNVYFSLWTNENGFIKTIQGYAGFKDTTLKTDSSRFGFTAEFYHNTHVIKKLTVCDLKSNCSYGLMFNKKGQLTDFVTINSNLIYNNRIVIKLNYSKKVVNSIKLSKNNQKYFELLYKKKGRVFMLGENYTGDRLMSYRKF